VSEEVEARVDEVGMELEGGEAAEEGLRERGREGGRTRWMSVAAGGSRKK